MSETKWTPGPWAVEYDNADTGGGGGQWFKAGPATVWFSYGATEADAARAKADARLIAAAPALYAALEDIVHESNTSDTFAMQRDVMLAVARAALAQASPPGSEKTK